MLLPTARQVSQSSFPKAAPECCFDQAPIGSFAPPRFPKRYVVLLQLLAGDCAGHRGWKARLIRLFHPIGVSSNEYMQLAGPRSICQPGIFWRAVGLISRQNLAASETGLQLPYRWHCKPWNDRSVLAGGPLTPLLIDGQRADNPAQPEGARAIGPARTVFTGVAVSGTADRAV